MDLFADLILNPIAEPILNPIAKPDADPVAESILNPIAESNTESNTEPDANPAISKFSTKIYRFTYRNRITPNIIKYATITLGDYFAKSNQNQNQNHNFAINEVDTIDLTAYTSLICLHVEVRSLIPPTKIICADSAPIKELHIMDCSKQLTFINFPQNLTEYTAHNCHYTDDYFMNLSSDLTKLNCSSNSIRMLNNLPDKLEKLKCWMNKIEKLDMLPSSLIELNCMRNQITNLNMLPENLILLDCSYNKIVQLNDLPRNLKKLNCSNNLLIQLNTLPHSLTHLVCTHNYVNSIILPKTIESIDARNNLLKTVPHVDKYLSLSNFSLDSDSTNIEKIKSVGNKIMWYSCKMLQWSVIGVGVTIVIGTLIITVPTALCYAEVAKRKHIIITKQLN